MSWSDIKGAYVAATTVAVSLTNANPLTAPQYVRLRGYSAYCSGAGGQLIISDVSISAGVGFRGTDRLTLTLPVSTAGGIDNFIQAGGIKFTNGMFVTVPTGGTITILYDGV